MGRAKRTILDVFLTVQAYGFNVELFLIAPVRTEKRPCTAQPCFLGSLSLDEAGK